MSLRRHARRRFSAVAADDDPLSLVPNLFDVSIVLAVAFLMASLGLAQRGRENRAAGGLAAGLRRAADSIERLKPPDVQQSKGRGRRLGVAYRLENGEIIYVPD